MNVTIKRTLIIILVATIGYLSGSMFGNRIKHIITKHKVLND